VVSFDAYDTSPGEAGPATTSPTTTSTGTVPSPTGSVVGTQASACVAEEATGSLARQVDFIFVVANSATMAQEIATVEGEINYWFVRNLETTKLDYRVIFLSHHGAHDGTSAVQGICVSSPLSGATCGVPPPPRPVETPRFFHHDVVIGATNALCRMLETFSTPDDDGSHPKGWSSLLRVGALKSFVVVTDDRVNASCNGTTLDDSASSGNIAAQAFDSALLALSPQFGTAAQRSYVWQSIVGVAPFDASDPTQPHPPSAPIIATTCTPGSRASGMGYQALSTLTHGARYPTCGLNYASMFQAIEKYAVDHATVGCDYPMPKNPSGRTIDPASGIVRVSSGASTTDFEQVAGSSGCAPKKFYIEDSRVKLCTEACGEIQADAAAQVKLVFNCLP
jgi:hypothetical protein